MEYKKTLVKIGRFLRIVDEREVCLSLSNIAVVIVLVKLCFAPILSIVDVGALLTALLAYSGKKVLNARKPTEMELPEIISGKLDALKVSAEVATVTADNRFTNIEDMVGKIKDKLGIRSLADSLRPKT